MGKEAEELRWEQEVLQQKYNQVSRERDEIQVDTIDTSLQSKQVRVFLSSLTLSSLILQSEYTVLTTI